MSADETFAAWRERYEAAKAVYQDLADDGSLAGYLEWDPVYEEDRVISPLERAKRDAEQARATEQRRRAYEERMAELFAEDPQDGEAHQRPTV